MNGRGWQRIGPHPAIAAWAAAALPLARHALGVAHQGWRCGRTWFVGVDALPNGPDGAVDGLAFPWEVIGLRPEPLHRAQLSTILPGYPRPDPGETAAAFGFRLNRDAAHLDGLLPVGPGRRRMIREPHGWLLGLPLTDASPEAAPLTVWDGSHRILRAALRQALMPYPRDGWADVDVTEAYQAARAEVFDRCPRVTLPARPGEAILLHRHTLHGVAPWADGASAPAEGRVIAYFRPQLANVSEWIDLP